MDDRTPAERGEEEEEEEEEGIETHLPTQKETQSADEKEKEGKKKKTQPPTHPPTSYDERMAGGGVRRIGKSRYDGISCYIYSCGGKEEEGGGGGGGGGRSQVGVGDEVLGLYNDVEVS